ncbi:DEAD/DEAH box helicase family protein [Flectobacillus roseus]|uniref:DEAD/DEAH box helicase family protein n=1 Tax=Flectobacillus roseus TaxID=502259 RepID=UPI0024B74D1B|nr:DEAD/DEAH box helicase family protein [Flectobacillus roseus]MDI9872135.1 DEAD/DEAH box helicase family protein [Flectobacillus roseus]
MDLGKLINRRVQHQKINPIEIYGDLDITTTAGPLRPAQVRVLERWFSNHKDDKDVVLKLHTGQGKTLIGLLILESKRRENNTPSLYLCPNQFLVEQTCQQAKKFGINICQIGADREIPVSFTNAERILITTIDKLINGMTKFGLDNNSTNVGSIILDDSHACIDRIKQAFTLKIENKNELFLHFLELFKGDLQEQGYGTFEDIVNYKHDSMLMVPYWAWKQHIEVVAKLLASQSDDNSVKFIWPLIKDELEYCYCFISGKEIEISPYQCNIDRFRSFTKASHRVFMSATTYDDSFLVKDLGLNSQVINNPLLDHLEKWSGEKMILMPSCISPLLDTTRVLEIFAKSTPKDYGQVTLVPSNIRAKEWRNKGSNFVEKDEIQRSIQYFTEGKFGTNLVIANRYDGIDLPDSSCRVLILDTLPNSKSLFDTYEGICREGSESVQIKIAQKIEQGLGRGVRGEKDFCAIIINGAPLVNFMRNKFTSKFFSSQTRNQISIAEQLIDLSQSEIQEERKRPKDVLFELLDKILSRREDWRSFYRQSMDDMLSEPNSNKILGKLEFERSAETFFKNKQIDRACKVIQESIIDKLVDSESEKGWYLQTIARYKFYDSITTSNEIQVSAHRLNGSLLKPRNVEIKYSTISFQNQNRVENIKRYIKSQGDFSNYQDKADSIISYLSFGANSNQFERAVSELGDLLGYVTDMPDRKYKTGPDVIWCLTDNTYLFFECKNEVLQSRSEIAKYEVGQFAINCTWFERNYNNVEYVPYMIIPTHKVSSKNPFTKTNVKIIEGNSLPRLKNRIKAFVQEFSKLDLETLNTSSIQSMLMTHQLLDSDLKNLGVSPQQI